MQRAACNMQHTPCNTQHRAGGRKRLVELRAAPPLRTRLGLPWPGSGSLRVAGHRYRDRSAAPCVTACVRARACVCARTRARARVSVRLWLFAFDFQVRRGGQLIIDYPSKTTATAASIRCAYAHHRASHRSHNTTWFLISDFPLAKEQVAPSLRPLGCRPPRRRTACAASRRELSWNENSRSYRPAWPSEQRRPRGHAVPGGRDRAGPLEAFAFGSPPQAAQAPFAAPSSLVAVRVCAHTYPPVPGRKRVTARRATRLRGAAFCFN